MTGKQHSTSTFPFTWLHQNTGKALYYNGQEGKREGRREEYSVFRKSFELERDVDWTPPTPPASSLSPPDWLKTSPFLASVSHSLSRTICHQVFWSLPSQHSHLCQSLYSYSVLNVLFRHLGLTSDEQGGGRGSLKFRNLLHTLRSKLNSRDWKAKV